MLTALVLIQCGINLALVGALFLLLRERFLTARDLRAREERLELLAAEFCALGGSLTDAPVAAEGRPVPAAAPGVASAPAVAAPAPLERPEQLHAVATFLERGLSVDAVVDRTALPQGEVQVLENLRRAQKPASTAGRGRRGAAPARRPAAAC